MPRVKLGIIRESSVPTWWVLSYWMMEPHILNSRLLVCTVFFFFSLERLEVSFQVRYVHNSYTGEAESSENLSLGIDVSLAVCGLPLQSPCDVSPILVEGAVRRKRWWQRIWGEKHQEHCQEGINVSLLQASWSTSTFTILHLQIATTAIRKSSGWEK